MSRQDVQRRASNRMQAGLGILLAILLFVVLSTVMGALSRLADGFNSSDDHPSGELTIDY